MTASLAIPSGAERARGLTLAAEGRCAAAVEELAPVLEQSPDDAAAWFVTGTCQARLGRYRAALFSLDQAKAVDASLPGLELRRGVVLYHLRELDASAAALRSAETRGATGELLLYQGLLALEPGGEDRRARAEDAARLFEAAARLDPSIEPAGSFYAGVAHRAAGDEGRARDAFEAVVQGWPDSLWRVDAERALAEAPEPRRPWAELMGGIEWDDNVLLRGSGVALPSEISSERDIRGVWSASAGGTLFESLDTLVSGRISYFGRAHRDLSDFDAHYPTASIWVDQRVLPETWLRAQLLAGYGWVDGDPFVSNHEASLSLVQEWTRGRSSFGVDFYRDNFRFDNVDAVDGPAQVGAPCFSPSDLICGPPGLDESRARNRDGNGLRLRTDHSVFLADWVPSIDVGYTFHRFDARGREYSFDAHELRVGSLFQLPLALRLGISGFFAYRPYRHPTTFPSTRGLVANRRYALPERLRRERTYEASVNLSRPIARWDDHYRAHFRSSSHVSLHASWAAIFNICYLCD